MPKVRPSASKPTRAPKARVATPKPAPATRTTAAPRTSTLTAKVALRAPNTRATNPLITKSVNARKSIRTK